MNKIKLKFYSDPGHGWLAVKRKVIYDMDLAGKITPYSYQRGQTVYLEEDLDANLLINTLRDRGIEITLLEKSTNKYSPIRSYDRFAV
jgi:hypothetical protein